MTDDFCLSDKNEGSCGFYYHENNVKEFIKRLKMELCEGYEFRIQSPDLTCGEIIDIIDKLAGQKLIEGEKGK